MSGTRVVVETPCEHGEERGHYLPHEEHQGPHVLQNRYGPDCPSCPGGSRRTLTPGELHEAIVQAMHAYAHSESLESACELADIALERVALPGRNCHPSEWSGFHGGADALAGADHKEGT